MQRRQLLAAFVGGLLLLTGFAIKQRASRDRARFVGIASTGDSVWVEDHAGEFWGIRVNGLHARGEHLTGRIDCGARTAQRADVAAVNELAPAIVDTACAMLRRP